MKKILEMYRKAHNDLVTAKDREPNGDHRAWLERVCEAVHKELVLAAGMIDEGKDNEAIHRVFDRVDTAFNRIK